MAIVDVVAIMNIVDRRCRFTRFHVSTL
jgi:hypothetical protein